MAGWGFTVLRISEKITATLLSAVADLSLLTGGVRSRSRAMEQMSNDLWHWNRRIEDHFDALARQRKDVPVFALEHGLDSAELSVLSDMLRAQIRVAPPSLAHALVWTVYATEIGYGYAGDEYWETFKEKTPGWTKHGEREWIRQAFVTFQKRFSGAKPSGPWAGNFGIIAWPITHAILPRDLQQQLARVLYDLRHSFSAELFDEPRRLGDFIAARSGTTSKRFQNLVQAPALVGQIAAALLLNGKEGFKTLLHPMTLKRIGEDLDREQRGRVWLLEARRAAVERAKIRGLTTGRSSTAPINRLDEARAEVAKLGIEPRLVLRPLEVDGLRWEVSLEIPDLSHLLLRFPQARDVLTDSRCTVAGAAGRPLARGRCLHGPQRVALSRWPRTDEILLKFERPEPQLEYLLRAECLLRPGTSWLFKIASDGIAYESRGMRVRAGSRYILVSNTPIARSALARSVGLACQGMHAVVLNVPTALTQEWEQTLRQLQLTQAKSIEVWPAGLAAAIWDGEGYGEWLTPETPVLAVRSDHAIDELIITREGGQSLSFPLSDTPPGEPVFIELPPLPVGLHKFSVVVRSGGGAKAEVRGDLDVFMRVREARSWAQDVTTHGPLDVEVNPATPSLEQLWEGKASVIVRGPAGRQLRCSVRMFTRSGEGPSFERQLPPLKLPLSSEGWARHFEANLKEKKDAQRAYDDAQVCEAEFSADELGTFTLRCEREFTPLRWSVRRDAAGYVARLHNDAGAGAPVVERYTFELPTIGERLPLASEHKAPHIGGLYVATLGGYKATIIVPPTVKDFTDLRCEPEVQSTRRAPDTVAELLASAQLWGNARVSGDIIAGSRQRAVVRSLMARIWLLIGGGAWGQLEDEFSKGDVGLKPLRREILPRWSPSAQLSYAISPDQIFPHHELEGLANAPLHKRGDAFVELIGWLQDIPADGEQRGTTVRSGHRAGPTVRRPQPSKWLAEFALRTASDPTTVLAWAGKDADGGIKWLLDAPTIARAARFLVLAVDNQRKSLTSANELYAGWGWSSCGD